MSFEYRVISLSDRGFFSGSLSTMTVQGKINEMADDGWELKDVTSVYDANIVGIRAGSPEVWLFFVREKKVKPPVVHGQQIKCKLEKDNVGNVDCPNCDVRLKLDANEIAAAKFTCPNCKSIVEFNF